MALDPAEYKRRLRAQDRAAEDGPADPGNRAVDFRGEKRGNATHRSVTDPDCRFVSKGSSGTGAYPGYTVNAVRLEPDFAFAWLNLAEILNVLGRNAEALGAYGEALKLRPELGAETRDLRGWLMEAPRRRVNPNERLHFDSISVLPPAGDHWVMEAPGGSGIAFFRNNVGKGRRHTVVAEIKLATIEPGRRGLPALVDELQRAWREVTRDPRFTPVKLSVGTARYSDVECVRAHGVVEDRGVIEGVVFLLESDEVHCPSPLDDRTLVTIAWSQRYPSWNDRFEFGKEIEPMLGSLRFGEQKFVLGPPLQSAPKQSDK